LVASAFFVRSRIGDNYFFINKLDLKVIFVNNTKSIQAILGGNFMQRKKSLRLFALLLVIFIFWGCGKSGSTTTDSTTDSTTADSAPSPAATVATYFRIQAFKLEVEKLGKFTAPEKLDPKAKIKGKVAIVNISASDFYSFEGFDAKEDEYNDKFLTGYGFTKDDLALSSDELDWLIQNKCVQGKEISTYSVNGRSIPAYELDCTVSVIDYKAPAVVARKKITGRDLDKEITISSDATYKNAYMPTSEIQKYIKAIVSK
jgi:hypothetical protein